MRAVLLALVLAAAAAADASSPIVYDAASARLYVVHPYLDVLAVVDPAGGRALAEVAVGQGPRSAAVDRTGRRLLVACERGGEVVALDLAGLAVAGRLEGLGRPCGVVTSPVADEAYLSLAAEGAVLVVDPATLEPIARIAVEAEPRGLALSPDGTTLCAVHFYTGRVTRIDVRRRAVESVVPAAARSNFAGAPGFDPSGRLLYVPQIASNASNRHRVFDTTVFPLVAVVDVAAGREVRARRIGLDAVDRPVSMPAALALDPAGERLYVVHSSSDDLSVIDLATGLGAGHLELGASPRGIVVSPDGRRAWVAHAVSDDVAVLDLSDPEAPRLAGRIPYARDLRPEAVQRGERLFFTSARPELSRDRWMSCASCHFDGEADGRTWFTPRGPRNTQSLVEVARTLPLHWSGDRADVASFQETIVDEMGGTGLSDADLADLTAYVHSLRPARSPHAATEAARRGRRLFESETTGCAGCHAPPLFTDGRSHDVGTGEGPDERAGPRFDTPSLLALHGTAPYLHDGRAADLRAVLTTANPADRHGRTRHLGEGDVEDLVAFLRSLPQE